MRLTSHRALAPRHWRRWTLHAVLWRGVVREGNSPSTRQPVARQAGGSAGGCGLSYARRQRWRHLVTGTP